MKTTALVYLVLYGMVDLSANQSRERDVHSLPGTELELANIYPVFRGGGPSPS